MNRRLGTGLDNLGFIVIATLLALLVLAVFIRALFGDRLAQLLGG